MTDDLNLHIDAIRVLFKKRFSGGCTYFDIDTLTDSKSIDILKGKDDVDKVFNILIKCIHEVHHREKIYNAVDVTTKDLETFVEQMTTSQLQSVMSFFDSMPKLRHVIQVTNPNTKKKGEVVVEGLQNFLG